jgi:RecA-family ATPase
MMLSEHMEVILKYNHDLYKKKKPILHEEEPEIVSHAISESYLRERTITLVLFEEDENIRLTGKVIRLDQQRRILKLQSEEDYDLIRLDDIVRVEN